jgi:hypothetical protein
VAAMGKKGFALVVFPSQNRPRLRFLPREGESEREREREGE